MGPEQIFIVNVARHGRNASVILWPMRVGWFGDDPKIVLAVAPKVNAIVTFSAPQIKEDLHAKDLIQRERGCVTRDEVIKTRRCNQRCFKGGHRSCKIIEAQWFGVVWKGGIEPKNITRDALQGLEKGRLRMCHIDGV
jgi:hypothetical protein